MGRNRVIGSGCSMTGSPSDGSCIRIGCDDTAGFGVAAMIGPVARRVFTWLAYLLAVLAFFEGSARLALRNEAFSKRVSGNDDATWRRRWLERHARLGTPLDYGFDEWSPTLGWKVKPNLRDTEAFRGKPLSTNSRGLRGSVEHSYEKPPGVFRIVVLGDSFTFGEEVGDEETYSHYLQELLPQVEVLNLGVHGYGHDQMLLYLQEEGLRYKPDLVLLGFLTVDMERNILAFRDYAKPRFVLRDGKLVLTHSPVPSVEETLAADKHWPRFFDLVSMLQAGYRFRSGAATREAKQLTLAILERDARDSRGGGSAGSVRLLAGLWRAHQARPAQDAARAVLLRLLRGSQDTGDLPAAVLPAEAEGGGPSSRSTATGARSSIGSWPRASRLSCSGKGWCRRPLRSKHPPSCRPPVLPIGHEHRYPRPAIPIVLPDWSRTSSSTTGSRTKRRCFAPC